MKLVPSRRRHSAMPFDPFSRFCDEPFWSPFPTLFGDDTRVQYAPRVDISEDEREIKVVADLPGYDPQKIEVELEDQVLTMKGTMEETHEERDDKRKWHCKQCSSGSFFQQFTLPGNVDEAGVRCKARNGKLTITLPKKGERRPKGRKVAVDVE